MTTRIEDEFARAIQENAFPGAAVLVASHGEVLYRNFFGQAALVPQLEAVTEKTLFDIASLTKPIATALLVLLAKKEGQLDLDKHLIDYFPEINEDKYKISIRHLLKHTSGLPAWRPYYEEITKEQPTLVGTRKTRTLYFQKISQETLQLPIGYQKIYSDLGFILLGILLEDALQKPLDQLFQEKIAGPLELVDTCFIPNETVETSRPIAATENSPWRKKVIRGEVHDDNAFTLGGVAGHAGLFSTVDDLHRLASETRNAYHGRSSWLPLEAVQEFIGSKVRFKLGWDTPSATDSQAGQYFVKNSIGHLGYTGCSLWINLDDEFHIILLTNRVHPSSANDQIKAWRPRLHDLLYEEIIRRV